MYVEYIYTHENVKEAGSAHAAFLANKPIKPPKTDSDAILQFVRGALGWIVFVILGVFLLVILHRSAPARVRAVGDSSGYLHNSRLIFDSVVIGPLSLWTIASWGMSMTARAPRAPFFTPADSTLRWPRGVWRTIGLLGSVAWVAASIDFGSLGTNFDWWPDRYEYILLEFLAWTVCLLLLGGMSAWLKRFAPLPLGHAESSLREKQRLEIDDAGITCNSDHMRTEYSWTNFVSYLESTNVVVLYTRNLQMLIIPKWVFVDESSLFEFFNVLQRHIPAGQFLPRSSGFPVVLPAVA